MSEAWHELFREARKHDLLSDPQATTCTVAAVERIVAAARADEKEATLRAVTSQLRVEQIQDPSVYNIWQRVHTCVARAKVEGEL